ncbi:hypothetical protein EPH95_18535 [Salicibibacter halophilus]|uniref:Uncharacterized protein n=1 Tax=Salicibibacter halophilus TaxID=2502791 RepID=A0A514LM23_9BACI|nr:hypothetical protein [Salicibibacter halophilus]QDI92914.1 hypothetical protein EPH95_18535 [Salicibibacter halophilus]
MNENDTLVSITSPVTSSSYKAPLPAKRARSSEHYQPKHTGASLLTYGNGWSAKEREDFENGWDNLASPNCIGRNDSRSSDIVSCGPAFFGFLLEEMTWQRHAKQI